MDVPKDPRVATAAERALNGAVAQKEGSLGLIAYEASGEKVSWLGLEAKGQLPETKSSLCSSPKKRGLTW